VPTVRRWGDPIDHNGLWGRVKRSLSYCRWRLAGSSRRLPPEDPKAKVRWTFAGSDCRRAQPAGKGFSTCPDGRKSGRACLGGRGTRLPRGRPARLDLTRVKSNKN
jgi:hypothetical protein